METKFNDWLKTMNQKPIAEVKIKIDTPEAELSHRMKLLEDRLEIKSEEENGN